MPTITRSIGTAGRDYSTITAWEADLDNPGVYANGDGAVGECHDDAAFDESVTINGGGTAGLASVTLTVAEGERHDGTAGTGARIVRTANGGIALATNSSDASGRHCFFDWLEFDHNGFRTNTFLLYGSGGHSLSSTRAIRHVVAHGYDGSSSDDATSGKAVHHVYDTPVHVLNSIFYDYRYAYAGGNDTPVMALAGISAASQDIVVANVTIHNARNEATGDAGMAGIMRHGNPVTVRNTVVTDITTSGTRTPLCFGSLGGTVDHNASSDATATGTGSLTGLAAAAQYVSIVSGSEDLHLKSGSDCIDAGTDLAGTVPGIEIDIDGVARSGAWDIGADEFVTAAVSRIGIAAFRSTLWLASPRKAWRPPARPQTWRVP